MKFERLDFENPRLLYLQVADIIEDKIINREIKVGDKIPPERKLNKTFGVSLDTIKEALSKLEREGYLTRRRSYGTSIISSKPRKGRDLKLKNEISIVVCHQEKDSPFLDIFGHVYMDQVIKGIEKKAREKGVYLIYSTIDGDKLSLAGKENDIAGLIVTGEVTPKRFRIIKKSKIPFVLIGDIQQKTRTNNNSDVICVDDFEKGYMAAKHLVDLGHKRVVYLTCTLRRYPWDIEQLEGYREAHREANIICDENLLIETKSLNIDIGYRAMKKFLKKSIPFTAVIYHSNILGIGAIKALGENGLKIPEDVSVVGIGRLPETTTVTYDLEELGKAAVERLIERITNPDWQPERVIIPNRLIIHDSARRLTN